jgi:hypothetical protein
MYFADAVEVLDEVEKKRHLMKDEQGGVTNKHGTYVPGWFITRYPHVPVDDFKERSPNPWSKGIEQSDYGKFYKEPAAIGQCCFATCIFHTMGKHTGQQ